MVPVALPHSLFDEFDMAVFRIGVTRSDAILQAVKDYINKVNSGELT